MKKKKDKKLILGFSTLIIGLIIIIIAIFLLQERPKEKKQPEIKETAKHTYHGLVIEEGSFDYSNGKMIFKATLQNNNKKDHEFEIALLVIKNQEGQILTEQSLVLPEVKAGSSEEITAQYEDVVENIADFEIKSMEEEK